jgi:hypothetical protein
MSLDPAPDSEDQSPEALLARYADRLTAAIETVGADELRTAGVEDAALEAIRDREIAALTLEDAATVVGAVSDDPDSEAILAMARDELLMGMTTAVLDVDALAARIDADLGPRAIQQRIEGRTEMTLAEYAQITAAIDAES